MDVGKVAWLLFEHPDLADLPLSESLQETKSRELRRKARYVAIPTSSGSGSEGTVGAVIVDREANPPFSGAGIHIREPGTRRVDSRS